MRLSAEKGRFESRPKQIFLEPLWKLRQEHEELLSAPPKGYQFVIRQSMLEGTANRLSKIDFAYKVLFALCKGAPMQLLKPYWERFKKAPLGTDLTYAVLHPLFRPEPWVMDMCGEQPHVLVSTEAWFRRFRAVLTRLLLSPYCRKIIYHVEAGKKALLSSLRIPELEEKIEVVYPAVPKRRFAKPCEGGVVRLLFVSSGNFDIDWQFRDKGGLVLLEAFRVLRQRFPNMELVMRSRVPAQVKARLGSMCGVRIIEEILPWQEFEKLFVTSDLLVCPAHLTPSMTFLDAMSYELPVVTTDVWSSPELVEDGRTGLLVHHPEADRYIVDSIAHHDWPSFKQVVSRVHPDLVAGVVEKVSLLIENPELRRRMGKEGRREVEEGKFSLPRQRARLKQLLDESLDTGGR